MNIPNDENGDVLRRMVARGDDLTKPRDVDFNHIFPEESQAKQFIEAANASGYERASYRFWAEKNVWDVLVKVLMPAAHCQITETEQRLDQLARQFGGRADGWGCLQPD